MATRQQNKTLFFQDLGRKDYKEVWDYQALLLEKIASVKKQNRISPNHRKTDNYFLFVEHPHVITIGKSGDMSNLLIDEKELVKGGISFYRTNRGGDITYHGPGQIVGYPILDLDNFFTDIHKYLRYLEEVVIKTLADYSIQGSRSHGETGVWIDEGTPFARKICAMGIRTSRWITMHGFAFNVNVDINYFDYIVPCGISKKVTSLRKELNLKNVDIEAVKDRLLFHFKDVFGCHFSMICS